MALYVRTATAALYLSDDSPFLLAVSESDHKLYVTARDALTLDVLVHSVEEGQYLIEWLLRAFEHSRGIVEHFDSIAVRTQYRKGT